MKVTLKQLKRIIKETVEESTGLTVFDFETLKLISPKAAAGVGEGRDPDAEPGMEAGTPEECSYWCEEDNEGKLTLWMEDPNDDYKNVALMWDGEMWG